MIWMKAVVSLKCSLRSWYAVATYTKIAPSVFCQTRESGVRRVVLLKDWDTRTSISNIWLCFCFRNILTRIILGGSGFSKTLSTWYGFLHGSGKEAPGLVMQRRNGIKSAFRLFLVMGYSPVDILNQMNRCDDSRRKLNFSWIPIKGNLGFPCHTRRPTPVVIQKHVLIRALSKCGRILFIPQMGKLSGKFYRVIPDRTVPIIFQTSDCDSNIRFHMKIT